MFGILLQITFITFTTIFIVYGLYVLVILRDPKKKEYIQLINQTLMKSLPREDLPNVTILVPAYNEETVISRKLQNLADLDYPLEKIEVILVDDCSSDRTCETAQKTFRKLGLAGKIIRNIQRNGPNSSYNMGVPNASNSLILRTDADVTIEADALQEAIKILSVIKNVGGITARMVPITDKNTAAVRVEENYVSFFDEMLTTESAIHSTFPGYGGFSLIKKSCFSPISIHRGSTDGNISLSIIKKGLRYIYVPHIVFHENISDKLFEQRRQKVRRATRMIQSAIMHRDILFQKKFQEFGRKIFPLRLAMLTLCPVLMLTGLIATFLALLSFSAVLALSLTFAALILLYIGTKINIPPLNLVTSLLIHQFYLLLGLFLAGKRTRTWKKIESF
jgi:biofilm PGA synthesis N-glycosyltransferase PgaC